MNNFRKMIDKIDEIVENTTIKDIENAIEKTEKIEVGEYIRTKNGCIRKVIKRDVDGHIMLDDYYKGAKFMTKIEEKEDIVRHSYNIADLIEEWDYVNDYEVITIYGYDADGNDKDELGIAVIMSSDEVDYIPLSEIKIKTVVTMEQIERIKYRVEE